MALKPIVPRVTRQIRQPTTTSAFGTGPSFWRGWQNIPDAVSYARAHPPGAAPAPAPPAPPAAAADSAPAAGPAVAAGPPPDPRDAQYGAGAARLLYDNRQQRDELGLQGTQDQQDFDTMLKRMAESRTQDLLGQDHQANRDGLFYSGQLGKRRGAVEQDYGNRQFDNQTAFDRRVAARAKALQDIGQVSADEASPLGFSGTGRAGLDLTDLYNGAVQRRLQRDQTLAY